LVRMRAQSQSFGPAELSRLADIVNTALNEMTGATSPRLHLELLVARALVPAADATERGALARVERLERRVGVEGAEPAPQRATEPAPAKPAATKPAPTPDAAPAAPAAPATAAQPAAPKPAPEAAPTSEPEPAPAPSAPIELTTERIRNAWTEILAATQATSRNAWMVAFTARVVELRPAADGDVLVLSFPSARDVDAFRKPAAAGAGVSEVLRGAIVQVLGSTVKFITRVESDTTESTTQDFAAAAAAVTAASPAAAQPQPAAAAPIAQPSPPAQDSPAVVDVDDWDVVPIPGDEDAPPLDEPEEPQPAGGSAVAAAPVQDIPDEPAPEPTPPTSAAPKRTGRAASSNRYGEAVLREVLGAEFIEEERS
ncbi:MAG: DNA polymerase III subunit gamma and tau, partial [Agromyces sp.]